MRVTVSWETLTVDSPVGLAGTGTAGCVGHDPVRPLAYNSVLVDGLDSVHVPRFRLDRIVGVGGVSRAGVGCDGDEGPGRVDLGVPAQDDVAGDGVVLRVVPGEGSRRRGRR